MPVNVAFFFGGPCDGDGHYIDVPHDPPRTLVCKGVTYHFIPGSRAGLTYGTQSYIDNYDAQRGTRGQRDVFQAWRRLMSVLTHRIAGEQRRMVGARHRIRRAVR